ncbi:THO complex subunit 3 [Amphibalanus amphitrite]|uniref:THO complex subunit 3 n=1 Tax=Amphibalanus amphitrite TaxID=1232801 RepID=A0A6A4VER6_AMPAM|nr:THO complex subunit 3-like [Amphibalanus amphitrite]XP_043200097.1 THO complex subunit 3-like [Amphibalanus amphitrite]KAF0292976.1 THO complex subunit 3 [Amphibalanus amphitrite]
MGLKNVEDLKALLKNAGRPRDYPSHGAKVHSVDWNCDGRRLASGSFDKSVCVFILDRDRLIKDHTFRGHSDSVDQLTWHPSHGDQLATASGDKTVRLWDARAQKLVATLPTKGENINISWSPNGQTIAVGNKEDLVSFIDVRQRKIVRDEQFRFEVNEITWNRENNLFFMTSGSGHIVVLSYPSLEVQHDIVAHPANCICIEFDPTGRHFAVGSADALLSVWDAQQLMCRHTVSRLDWPVRTLSFSHDGELLAAASEDLLIDISAVSSGERVTTVPVQAATYTVAWHPSRYVLAFACDDKDERDRDAGTVKLWGVPE